MIRVRVSKKDFDEVPNGDIVCAGVTPNNPEGIFATRDYPGRLLLWVMVKGYADDWAVYYHWADRNSVDEVRDNGDKLFTEGYIKNILDLDLDVMRKFRS